MSEQKIRLDQLLVERGLADTRSKAEALIRAGQVFVANTRFDKPGKTFSKDVELEVKELFPYVSRAALKIETAYDQFDLNFRGKIICDVGSSTGGFTDFSLTKGAKKVYAIDVGRGQLAWRLRNDSRVVSMEETDFREVGSLPEEIDSFLVDVSFISLKKIIPQIKKVAGESKPEVVLLVKPQFEAGVKEVSKGKGVIRDEAIRVAIVEDIKEFSRQQGFEILGQADSKITGAKGNKEFLVWLRKASD